MPRRSFRLLGGATANSDPAAVNSDSAAFDSDLVVILAALLCALVCVLGLVSVARCAWLRRLSGGGAAAPPQPPPANKGLKKKVLRALPKHTFTAEASVESPDCAICLAEFAAGDELRVLPQCGHGFHVACIDTWLGSHSSCPSCRQVLVVERCQKCGSLPGSSGGGGAARPKGREDDVNWFLP